MGKYTFMHCIRFKIILQVKMLEQFNCVNCGLYQTYNETGPSALILLVRKLRQEEVTILPIVS